jgi:dTDP-4-dehydrorhamnose reductase
MKRVLVTGASGQLGMTIKELSPKYPDLNFTFKDRAELDITRPEQVGKVFEEYKPHYCINCAAYTQVDQAERTPEPAYDVNVIGVKNLVNAC